MKVTVVGSGPVGLGIAADMVARGGHEVVVTDLPVEPGRGRVSVIVGFLCETEEARPGLIFRPRGEGTGSGL